MRSLKLPVVTLFLLLACMSGNVLADTFLDTFSSASYGNQDGTNNWLRDWNETDDGGDSPTGGDIEITGGELHIQDRNNAIDRAVDLSGYSAATLSFDYRVVSMSNSNEWVDLEIRTGGTGTWTFLQRFEGPSDNSGSYSIDISGYLDSNTELRFSSSSDMGDGDDFYVDNFLVTTATALPSPAAEYRFDESAWSGATSEVLDATGNGNDGTALQTASGVQTIDDGFICRAGTFPDIDDGNSYAVDTGLVISSDIGSAGAISLWHRSPVAWSSTGSDKVLWDASSDGSDDKYFYLILLDDGRLRFGAEDSSDGDYRIETSSAPAIAADEWAQVVVNWDVNGTEQGQIWINGVQQAVTTVSNGMNGSTLGTTYSLYLGDNRSTYHPEGSDRAAAGDIDEVLVFDQVLTGTQIDEIRTLQSGGMNLDGTTRTCSSTTVVAEYYFDEASWDGSSDEVLDSSGGGFDGLSNGASTIADGQVCRAGSFNGSSDYLTVNGIDSSLRETASLSFWVKTTQTGDDTNWRAPGVAGIEQSGGVDDIFWGWIDAAGHIGVGVGDTGLSQSSTPINDGAWHHIVHTRNAVTGELQTYVDGVLEDTTAGNAGVIGNGFSSLGRIEDTGGTPAYFAGDLDEVVIFNSVLSTAQVQSIYNNQLAGLNRDGSARTCASVSVDHYAISPSGSGITCEPLTVTITAHDDDDMAVTPSNGTVINLSTSTGRGLWTGSGTDNGTVSYTFDGSSDSVSLDLLHAVAGTVNININSGSSPNEGSGEDPDIVFYDSRFRFIDSGDNPIGVQVSAKPSATHYLEAVRTDDVTQQCVAMFQNQTVNVGFAAECENPANCTDSDGNGSADLPLQLGYNGGGFFSVPTNDEDGTSSALSFSTLQAVSFDASGRAPVVLRYDDAGRINVHARAEITDSNGNATGEFIEGFNNVVVKPAGLCVQAQDMDGAGSRSPDCVAGDASCSVYMETGNPFGLLVAGKAWVSDGESNSDFCDNTTTPNFVLNSIALSPALVAPGTGVNGSLSTTSATIASDGEVAVSEAFSEVGVFTFTATPPDYFGEPIAASTSANVGRFIPHHFVLENTSLTPAIGAFTYMGQPFSVAFDIRAVNSDGNTTVNYRDVGGSNNFIRLDIDADISYGAVDGTPTYLTSRLSAAAANPAPTWGNGVVLDVQVPLTLARDAVVDGPLTAVDIGLALADDDLAALAPGALNLDTEAPAGNDRQQIGAATEFRYGRAFVPPVYGPEIAAGDTTPIPFVLQYWNGSGFITSNDDSISQYDAWTEAACTDGSVACSDVTFVQATTGATVTTGLSDRVNSMGITRPGAGNTGELTLQIDVDSWFEYDWNGTGAEDPASAITFGTYRGHDRIIYWRERL